jgi:hypothetical protein
VDTNYSLDVDTPEELEQVLLRTAQLYRDSAVELASAHQDRQAGKYWSMAATRLERIANELNKIKG